MKSITFSTLPTFKHLTPSNLSLWAVVGLCLVLLTTYFATTAQPANIDTDRIQIVSQVNTELSVQQQHAWITVQGYYELHHSDGYLTLDVTNSEFADDPIIPWFSCRNNSGGGTSCLVERDPEYDDEQFASFDFDCPPTDVSWYFRLTLWVDNIPIDHYYFFSGVGAYRP